MNKKNGECLNLLVEGNNLEKPCEEYKETKYLMVSSDEVPVGYHLPQGLSQKHPCVTTATTKHSKINTRQSKL